MVKNKSNMLYLLVIITITIILILVFKGILNKNNRLDEGENKRTVKKESINYESNLDGSKINMNEEIAKDQKIGNILIEKSNITYENGISKLTSKVTNNGVAKENLKFTIKLIGNNGNTLAELIGLVGKIEVGQTKYISSKITKDITNAKQIVYEIIQ
ncbi:MAG: hypothetical protein PHR25_03505 [Clostridia bacterium]|nr:hypothetical protein [Clostridia bacterium]MDD4375827.1 hypothetical protein [Clostridia bacterium]